MDETKSDMGLGTPDDRELSRRSFVRGAAATGVIVLGAGYVKPTLRILGVTRLAQAASSPPGGLPPPSPSHGCTPGFWGNNSSHGQGGGVSWWDSSPDPLWTSHGGHGNPPFVQTTLFSSFFTPNSSLSGMTMWDIVNGGGGPNPAQRAARQLVAAYLNAAFGSYPFSTSQLSSMWTTATNGGTSALNSLQVTLENTNQACDATLGG